LIAPAIKAALLKNLPGAHLASAQHLNVRKQKTYCLTVGVGSALAALPIFLCLSFQQKIGTFSAETGFKLRCSEPMAMRSGDL